MVKTKQINLIPKDHQKHGFKWSLRWREPTVIVIFALTAPLFFYSVQRLVVGIRLKERVVESKDQLADAKLKLKQMQSTALDLEKQKSELTKEKDMKQQRLDLLLSTSARGKKYSTLMAFMVTLLPENLWMKKFALTETEVTISGTTFEPELITTFMNQLNGSKYFKNSRFTSSEKQVLDSQAVHNFTIMTEPVWN